MDELSFGLPKSQAYSYNSHSHTHTVCLTTYQNPIYTQTHCSIEHNVNTVSLFHQLFFFYFFSLFFFHYQIIIFLLVERLLLLLALLLNSILMLLTFQPASKIIRREYNSMAYSFHKWAYVYIRCIKAMFNTHRHTRTYRDSETREKKRWAQTDAYLLQHGNELATAFQMIRYEF